MNRIYKYPIKITDEQEIMMPYGAEIIHAGLDPQGTPCLWAIVQPDKTHEPVEIIVTGTGEPLSTKAARHLGSFVQGQFVWHVFLTQWE